MNKLKYVFLSLAMLACGLNAMAQTDEDARLRNKINDAVMKVYDDQLAKDPDDYATRFARAYQCYNVADYDQALTDATIVIETMPEKEKELLLDALLLRAKTYDKKADYDNEYRDLQRAFGLNSQNLSVVDMIAKVAYKRGDYQTAETNFNVILRQSPQNYDALYWLGKTAVKRSDYAKAQEYCDRAVKLFPAESQVYINRSDVFSEMGQYKVAAQDLILAMSVGNDESKAVSALIDMSEKHYDDVMSALQNSIDNAPRVGTFYYIRYSIAMRHLHYAQALKDLKSIVDNAFFDDASVYYDMAKCQFHLCRYDDALTSIDRSLSKDNSVDALLLKARIIEYQGNGKNYDAALGVLLRASRIDATNVDVMLAQARVYIAQRNQAEALAALNKAVAVDSKNNEALLLRGWLNKYRMRNAEGALADFGRVVNNGSDMASLRGFALHELGRDDEARKWASDIIMAAPLPGGEAYAVASALLSDIGDNDQAYKYLESALANGFGSAFDLLTNEEPYVNLKLVRRHANFTSLCGNYTQNFEVK